VTAWTSASITVSAVQWTGSNLAEVREFAGPDFISASDEHVWVRNAGGPFQIHPGYWLARSDEDPTIVISSPAAWKRHQFRPAT